MGPIGAQQPQTGSLPPQPASLRNADPETLQAVVDSQPVTEVPLRVLVLGRSPRRGHEDIEHIQRIIAVDGRLPPIVVHRATMWVIDGAHRLRAALQRGDETINVRFFDGSVEDAFVLAVNSNVTHGLPLSLSDREAAAARILVTHHWWSDRAIASAVGLSAKKVRTLRRSSADGNQSNRRLGRDGRIRPVDASAGRARASELFAERPEATIREIAREAGVSVSTAHDVRRCLQDGEQSTRRRTPRQREAEPTEARPARSHPTRDSIRAMHQQMTRDPRIRYSPEGRVMLRWLEAHLIEAHEFVEIIDAIPKHWSTAMADLARQCVDEWQEVIQMLDQRG